MAEFPRTVEALIDAGYRYSGRAACSACKAPIEWWMTPKAKKMPMDVKLDGTCEPHWASCPNAKDFRNGK